MERRVFFDVCKVHGMDMVMDVTQTRERVPPTLAPDGSPPTAMSAPVRHEAGPGPLAEHTLEENTLEESTQAHGRMLLAALRRREGRRGSDWLYEHLMHLATADEATRVQLFRFVDVLPALRTAHAVAQHESEFLGRPEVKLPPGMRRLLLLLSRTSFTERLLSGATHFGTSLIARRFIAGRDAREATNAVLRLRRQNMAFTLDLLGEAVTSEAEALAYQQKYLSLIREMAEIARDWPVNNQIDVAPWGPLPRANISLKLSSLYARFDPMAADATAEAVKNRLRPILAQARDNGVFVNFDMEQNRLRGITRRIFEEVLWEDDFRDWPDAGIVVQAYLRDAQDDLEELRVWSQRRGTPVWVRLVKGAYWDYETIVAAQRGYPTPVFDHKAETDANYERLTEYLLAHWETLRPAIATHNVRSAARAQAIAQELKLPPRAIEYQVLYGMGEPMGRALAAQGERVRVYVPFGELLPGMAYLVRRLLENTSNDSFIRHVEQRDRRDAELLAPSDAAPTISTEATGDTAFTSSTSGFRNEPETDFDVTENQAKMRAALSAVAPQLGTLVTVVIDNRQETSPQVAERRDPSDTGRVASRSHWATPEQAKRAVAAAQQAFPNWRETPVAERAALLRRVAQEFRRRRFEIAAWQVYEVGKPWRDADADVAEAIDFCEYYAAEMECLVAPRRRDVPGEWNDYFYEARGPAVIIAPWNFPLAILTGMSVAVIVAGNSVVIKPSEQAARVGAFLVEALLAAGAPPGVANFLPGEGEAIGPVLVNDPRVALIAFTGSREVGLSILRDAAVVHPGQREIKRVIAELGGKNAIIVDEDADLDEAVLGVLTS
ncbi:MAG TPA: proline dehydrogenase family protein, partial [Abditibacteriaceae bacterium]|nr:proline dehydrogenase family protein [Abditibacteriaceae bacterium]